MGFAGGLLQWKEEEIEIAVYKLKVWVKISSPQKRSANGKQQRVFIIFKGTLAFTG